MKYLIFFSLTLAGYPLFSQTPPAAAADSLFIVSYTTGPGWQAAKPPQEQTYFKEHSQHLQQLRKDGLIKAGARYSDKGIIIVSAASLGAARALVDKDLAIQHALFHAEVHKFNVFFEGCLERQR